MAGASCWSATNRICPISGRRCRRNSCAGSCRRPAAVPASRLLRRTSRATAARRTRRASGPGRPPSAARHRRGARATTGCCFASAPTAAALLSGRVLAGVHTLRGIADAAAIHADMRPGARAVIIGGGYIGLETASTARALGCEVTVLEMADRRHEPGRRSGGVEYFRPVARGARCAHRLRHPRRRAGGNLPRRRGWCVRTAARHEADSGRRRGRVATTALAAESGLACNNGIVVDEYCRTADPGVFAAGDCTNHPSQSLRPAGAARVRRQRLRTGESGRAQYPRTAASSTTECPGSGRTNTTIKLLIVGLSAGHDQAGRARRPATPRLQRDVICAGGELLALEARQPLEGLHGGAKADRRAQPPRSGQGWPTRRRRAAKKRFDAAGSCSSSRAAAAHRSRRRGSQSDGSRQTARRRRRARPMRRRLRLCDLSRVRRSGLARPLPPAEEIEDGMLEPAWEPRYNSRLSCQMHGHRGPGRPRGRGAGPPGR